MLVHNRTTAGDAIRFVGPNVTIRDFSHYGTVLSRGADNAYGISSGDATGCIVERIWMERHIGWIGGADNGLVKNCRVKNTVADGFTAVKWVDNFTWRENYFRNTGDDCAAIWSQNTNPPPDTPIDSYQICTNARWINNDMVCVRWGSGAGVWGSQGGVVQNNYMADTQRRGGVAFDTTQVTMGTSNFTISGNTFVRCGASGPYNWNEIAATIEFSDGNAKSGGRTTGIIIENNEFVSPPGASVRVLLAGQPCDFIFRTNTITNSAVPVLIVRSDAGGTAQFNNNTATNFTGSAYFQDNSPTFSFTKTGNIPGNWP